MQPEGIAAADPPSRSGATRELRVMAFGWGRLGLQD